MLILKTAALLQSHLLALRKTQQSIGFVPTMGALHAGHISLLSAAKAENTTTVCSIFVNPTQFDNEEDLAKYPRSTEADIDILEANGCDILYLPEAEDVYPPGAPMEYHYDLGAVAEVLEATHRPGHFQGVAQVVDRLLGIVQPDVLYLGQKDLQQIAVISTMVRDRYPGLKIKVVATARNQDGLALSSRNTRLNMSARSAAPTIYQCLISIQAKAASDSFEKVRQECEALLRAKGFTVDYIALINGETFQPLADFDNGVPMAALIAASIGGVRLIDNIAI